MLADGLGRAISLDPLRSGVPAGDGPVGIQHVDRMVADRIDQQLKTLSVTQMMRWCGPAQRHPFCADRFPAPRAKL
jgi:hypothetical protein